MTGLPEFDLHGRSAAITGGALGLGAGMARALHRAGAQVALIDKDADAATQTSKTLAADGGPPVHVVVADVSDADACAGAVRRAAEVLGALDVLINNAGIYPVRTLDEVTSDLVDSVLHTNLSSTLFASRAAAAVMASRGTGGSLINIASLEGMKPSMGGLLVYGASKGGVLALSRHLAIELAPMKIRVNVIAPGAMVTEGSAQMTETSNMSETERQAMLAAFEQRVPLRRLGEPADLGGAAIFLASDASAYVTGAVLTVDGGLLISP